MVSVHFKFNKEKDIWNVWDSANYNSPWNKITPSSKKSALTDRCKNRKLTDCSEDIEKFYDPIYNSFLIENIRKSFQNAWDKINDSFFERLEKITGNAFPFDEVTAYLTTQMRCPYDEDEGSFMVSIFRSIPDMLQTAGHELMHLDFHKHNWDSIEEELGRKKTADLKEALTILLNVEFKDLWFVSDKGYELHEDLREFILTEWEKDKDYKRLLEKCILFLKSS